ncbi:MAG: hypothetical protein ACRDWA_14825 [Acidimicrobiia bacterium]
MILALLLARTITSVYGDVTGFLKVPAYDPSVVAYMEHHVGSVVFAPEGGHDGHFFFMLAMDPWLLSPGEHGRFLDRPAYRAQRILYPMLAGGFGTAGSTVIVWSLMAINIAALSLGTWATSRAAMRLGGSAWSGLFFVLNPGLIYEFSIDGSSILGMAFAMLGLLLASHERWTVAATLLAMAALSRETMLLVALGALAYSWRSQSRPVWRLIAVPALASLAWAGWIRLRLGDLPNRSSSSSFDEPLQGLIESVPAWFDLGGLALWLGILSLGCAAVTVVASVKRANWLAWGTVLFAPLLVFLSAAVLRADFNLTRAIAPLITSGLVLLTSPWSEHYHRSAFGPSIPSGHA